MTPRTREAAVPEIERTIDTIAAVELAWRLLSDFTTTVQRAAHGTVRRRCTGSADLSPAPRRPGTELGAGISTDEMRSRSRRDLSTVCARPPGLPATVHPSLDHQAARQSNNCLDRPRDGFSFGQSATSARTAGLCAPDDRCCPPSDGSPVRRSDRTSVTTRLADADAGASGGPPYPHCGGPPNRPAGPLRRTRRSRWRREHGWWPSRPARCPCRRRGNRWGRGRAGRLARRR